MPLPNIVPSPRPRPQSSDGPDYYSRASDGQDTKSKDSNAATPNSLEFGIYRDGDNNLDEAQSAVLNQAQSISAKDPDISFHVEDTTQRDDGLNMPGMLRTEEYNLTDGSVHDLHTTSPQDMADRSTLAKFVANTLNQAQQNNASSTWLDLVDHGGGNGGAFQTNSSGGGVMREDDIAGAIADGLKMHAQAHPEDANRSVEGVVFNACLMATCGMEAGYYTRG